MASERSKRRDFLSLSFITKLFIYIFFLSQILVDAAAGYGLPPSQSFLFLLWASRRLFCHNNRELKNHDDGFVDDDRK